MKKHTFRDWFIATRPWSFPASAMPVVATVSYLQVLNYHINWLNSIWALVNIILFHAAGNTWSDYFDYKKGVDDKDTFGAKTLTNGEFTPQEIYRLGTGLLFVAVCMGLGLLWRTGLPLLWIGLGGICCTLFYPFLKYRALGDMVIFLAYAWLPTWGTSYVAAGVIDMHVLGIALPIGLITVAILHANNTRDIKTDIRAGISTLAIRSGQPIAIGIYCAEILLPFLWIIAGICTNYFPLWSLLTLIALPPSIQNITVMFRLPPKGAASIAHLDEKTAKLQLLFSLSLTLSFFLSAWLS